MHYDLAMEFDGSSCLKVSTAVPGVHGDQSRLLNLRFSGESERPDAKRSEVDGQRLLILKGDEVLRDIPLPPFLPPIATCRVTANLKADDATSGIQGPKLDVTIRFEEAGEEGAGPAAASMEHAASLERSNSAAVRQPEGLAAVLENGPAGGTAGHQSMAWPAGAERMPLASAAEQLRLQQGGGGVTEAYDADDEEDGAELDSDGDSDSRGCATASEEAPRMHTGLAVQEDSGGGHSAARRSDLAPQAERGTASGKWEPAAEELELFEELITEHPFTIRRSDARGRLIAAATDLAAGSVVLRELPLMAALLPRHLPDHCCNCFLELPTGEKRSGSSAGAEGVPCPKGCSVKYCSDACLKADRVPHLHQCKLLQWLHQAGRGPDRQLEGLLFFSRVLGVYSALRGAPDSPLLDQLQRFPAPSPDAASAFAVEAAGERLRHEANTVRALQHFFSEEIAELGITAAELERVVGQVHNNLHGIVGGGGAKMGSGLYSCASLFNHACRPNCMLSWEGRQLVCRTTRPVACGEELTIAYTELYQPPGLRQSKLFASKGFLCACAACSEILIPGSGQARMASFRDGSGVWLLPQEEARLCPPDEDDPECRQHRARMRTLQEMLAAAQQLRGSGSGTSRQVLEMLEAVLEHGRSECRLHPHHWLLHEALLAHFELACEAKDDAAALQHGRELLEQMRTHLPSPHPGTARVLERFGSAAMRRALQRRRSEPRAATEMLQSAIDNLQEAQAQAGVMYGSESPVFAHLEHLLSLAHGVLSRLQPASP